MNWILSIGKFVADDSMAWKFFAPGATIERAHDHHRVLIKKKSS
jgi:hypothetical protein